MKKEYITLSEESLRHLVQKIIEAIPKDITELNNNANFIDNIQLDEKMLYPPELLQEVLFDVGGFQKGESLTGMPIQKILEKLLCGKVELKNPTFLGIMDFCDIDDITYELLNTSPLINKDIVTKPITTYTHGKGSMFNMTHVRAFPIELGNIIGVSDNARVSLSGSYHWKTVTFSIDGEPVQYVVGCNKKPLMFADGVTIKWSIN